MNTNTAVHYSCVDITKFIVNKDRQSVIKITDKK